MIKLNPKNFKIKAWNISSETPCTTTAAATKVSAHKVEKAYIPRELVNQTRTTNLFFLPALFPSAFSPTLFLSLFHVLSLLYYSTIAGRIYRRRKFSIGASRREAETDCDARQNTSGARRIARSEQANERASKWRGSGTKSEFLCGAQKIIRPRI